MDGTLASSNGQMYQSKHTLPDGTFERIDTMPKQDYYKSLRRHSASSPGSQFQINNSMNVYDATTGYRKSKAIDYKPSGKMVQCSVLMLEGVEQMFAIDKSSYGLHLFKAVCQKLDLTETEYFGLTFRGNHNVDVWLKMDEKIAKQLENNPWKFEFRFKFYPAFPEYLKDDLTRYFLCLQIRQDIICGQLPCSFNTYVILGAYVIQSEAGDWDPENHVGIEYLYNVPFAPKNLQTPEMLVRINELHKKLIGRTPEQADRMFLENARRLALYGVHLHRVKNASGEDVSLGVYHSGILVYLGRLRMQRYTWARIVELSYRGKEFIVVVRPVIFDEYIEPTGTSKRRSSISSPKAGRAGSGSSGVASSTASMERGTSKQRSRSAKPSGGSMRNKTLVFKCLNADLAKRLYQVVVEHHTFFRLREGSNSKRLNLMPGFGTRKYHYSSRQQVFDDDSAAWTLTRDGALPPSGSIRRVHAQRRPEQYAKTLVTLMTPVAARKGANFRAPCASLEDAESLRNGSYVSATNVGGPRDCSVMMEESYSPVKQNSPTGGTIVPTKATNNNQAARIPPGWTRLPQSPPQAVVQMPPPPAVNPPSQRATLSKQHWQMSPADCTQGLGMDLYGTDVATMMNAGWQGSRTNLGIKGPGSYYYEVSVLEDGDVRVGWSANDATLELGMDNKGYGYGAAQNGDGSSIKKNAMGRLIHSGEAHEMGFPALTSDVIGCFLQLRKDKTGAGLEGNVMWSHNGQLITSPHANLVQIPSSLATNSAFFPTVALRDARVSLNFGEKPFVHPPDQISGGRVAWTAPVYVPPEQTVQNANSGWRINTTDVTSTLHLTVSDDGRMAQATSPTEWQGFRANKGVFKSGKYYYEVEMVEDCGYARVGWSLPTADLQLGVDNLGYGYGCAPDGSPAKKVFNGEAEDYGVKVKVGDVVGCFLDLDNGVIQWSVNGEMLPPAYYMDSTFITHDKTVFFPSASLCCTTLEVNYGDRPFKYQPSDEWYPLFAAMDEYVQDSPNLSLDGATMRQPHATTERVESDILRPEVTITVGSQPTDNCRSCDDPKDEEEKDTVIETKDGPERSTPHQLTKSTPHQSAIDIPLNTSTTEAHRVTEETDPEVTVEYYVNEEGQRLKRIIQKQRKVVTTIHKASVERFETTHVKNLHKEEGENTPGSNQENADEALSKAIHETTKLDTDDMVVNGSTSIRSETSTSTHRNEIQPGDVI